MILGCMFHISCMNMCIAILTPRGQTFDFFSVRKVLTHETFCHNFKRTVANPAQLKRDIQTRFSTPLKKKKLYVVNDSVASYSTVSMIPRSQTQRCEWHCGAWLRCDSNTEEFDSAVSLTQKSQNVEDEENLKKLPWISQKPWIST